MEESSVSVLIESLEDTNVDDILVEIRNKKF